MHRNSNEYLMILPSIRMPYCPFSPSIANFMVMERRTMFNKENNVLRSIPALIFISIRVNAPEHKIPTTPVIK
jgi:hypothetical protein